MSGLVERGYGDDASVLVARIRDMQQQARQIKQMVTHNRPSTAVLLSLCRLRRDLNEFRAMVLEARLRQISGSRSRDEVVQVAVREVVDLLRHEHSSSRYPAMGGRRAA